MNEIKFVNAGTDCLIIESDTNVLQVRGNGMSDLESFYDLLRSALYIAA